MRFQVTIEVANEVVYEAVHDADGAEPALRDAMRVARKACPGKPVYLSAVTMRPLDAPEGLQHGDGEE